LSFDPPPFEQPWLQTATALALLVLLAFAADWIARTIVRGLIRRGVARSPLAGEQVQLEDVAARLSNVVPAIVVQAGVGLAPGLPSALVLLTRNLAAAFMILTIALALGKALGIVNDVYQRRPDAANRPIKGYLQVAKIVVYSAALILMVAALMDRSPLLLLSGLGAMAAVLMLVFKDTILSLVASVQISSNDMVRVGDWIEMPQLNADGAVVDIALHTVKVQNWDKTITTVPTHRLISESFKNWRGMSESGGRRIKRALMIDQTSIRFLPASEVRALQRFSLIADYLDAKQVEIARWNGARPERAPETVNARRVTNLGTLRAYIQAYLRAHPGIAQDMTLLVRQLAPSPAGLPIEIYCFTASTAWADYEATQGDIFDHLLAILPEFGLRLFQQPTGADLAALGGRALAA
jgi:miniconductance mechanosensitive channel